MMTKPIQLDDLLTLEECSEWIGLNKRDLSAKSKGRRAVIPGFWINRKVVRFHPRTVLAKLARESGVPESLIAAAFSFNPQPSRDNDKS
jgi:hypothetical protein